MSIGKNFKENNYYQIFYNWKENLGKLWKLMAIRKTYESITKTMWAGYLLVCPSRYTLYPSPPCSLPWDADLYYRENNHPVIAQNNPLCKTIPGIHQSLVRFINLCSFHYITWGLGFIFLLADMTFWCHDVYLLK